MPPKIESILFCPHTPNSIVRERYQETEDTLNGRRATCRVKVVERAGPTVSSLLNRLHGQRITVKEKTVPFAKRNQTSAKPQV